MLIGGFMGAGTPSRLIDALVKLGRQNLTVIANDTARPGVGIGKLIDAKLVSRIVTSHIGTNPETQSQMIAGEVQVDRPKAPWSNAFARGASVLAAC